MSLQFSNTTTKNGILQKIERLCKFDDGGITGNVQRLAEFTSEVNQALDKALSIIFKASGKWQFDDSNHTDYPFIMTDLVTPQRDYTFTVDGSDNLILDIYRVMVKNTDGTYFEIYPVDQQSDEYTEGFWSGINTTGIPSRYDKTANGIFLDCIPSYNADDGLKIFINREGSYFSTSDTTKMPGFAGLFHKYLAVAPSYEFSCTNQLANKNDLKQEMMEMELDIKQYYRDRSKDEVLSITTETICSI